MVCEQDYELLEQIGRGSYGKVYRAQHASGEVHAIKVVELESTEDDMDDIQQEIKMLQAFNCPQLTRYHGSFIVGSALWISMEYLEGGSLQDLMKTSADNLDEHTTQWILREMLKALVYLHSERKIHRDVKAGNILVASDGSVRLADFGESVQLTHSIAKRQTFAGSPYWMAPEVIMAQDTYNSKADIWSLGVTAIEMIKGRPPYSEMHPMKAVLCIPNNPPPTLDKDGHYSKHFHVFLEQCFQRDPNIRPSAQDLLRHPFMRAARPTDTLKKLLEARRAAEMMKSLFGTTSLNAKGGTSIFDATHKAKPTTLPASAAAAIAAAQAANPGAVGAAALSKPATVEWDFGDEDADPSEGASAEGREEGADQQEGKEGEGVANVSLAGMGTGALSSEIDAAVSNMPLASPEAATPKARGGSSGGMWLFGAAASEKESHAHKTAAKEPPALGERQRSRGTMSKIGTLLGIRDPADAVALQHQMTALSHQQDKAVVRRKKAHGQGCRMSSKSASATSMPTATSTTTRTSALSLDAAFNGDLPTDCSSPPPLRHHRERASGGALGIRDGRRRASGSETASSTTSPSTAAATTSPTRRNSASSRKKTTAAKHASCASAGAVESKRSGRGHRHEGNGRSGASKFGRLFRGNTRDNGADTSDDPEGRDVGGEGLSTGPATAGAMGPSGETCSKAASGGVKASKRASPQFGLEVGFERRSSRSLCSDDTSPGKHHGRETADSVPDVVADASDKARATSGTENDDQEEDEEVNATVGVDKTSVLVDGGGHGGTGPSTLAGGSESPKTEGDGDDGTAEGRQESQQRQGEATHGEARRSRGGRVRGDSKGVVSKRQGGSENVPAAGRQQPTKGGDRRKRANQGVVVESPPTSPPMRNRWEKEDGSTCSGSNRTPDSSLSRRPSPKAGEPVVVVTASAGSRSRSTAARKSAAEGDCEAEVTMRSPSSSTISWGTFVRGHSATSTGESPGVGSVKSSKGIHLVGTDQSHRGSKGGRGAAVIVDDDEGNNGTAVGGAKTAEDAGESAGVVGAGAGAGATAVHGNGDEIRKGEVGLASSEEADELELDSTKQSSLGRRQDSFGDENTQPRPPLSSGDDGAAAAASEAGSGDGLLEKVAGVVAQDEEGVGSTLATVGTEEEEDSLTATFHAHLTPALCEIWDATEDGSAQRQAVQDLAMALERLDGCSNGQLTLQFVEAVAKCWPSGQTANATSDATSEAAPSYRSCG